MKTSHNACSSITHSPAGFLAKYEHALAESWLFAVAGGTLIPSQWLVLNWDGSLKAPTASSCIQPVFCAEMLNIFNFFTTLTPKNITNICYSVFQTDFFWLFLSWHDCSSSAGVCRFWQAKTKRNCKMIVLQVLLMLLLIIKHIHLLHLSALYAMTQSLLMWYQHCGCSI